MTEPTVEPTDTGDPVDDTDDGQSPNREAAKYRTRLREVEAERDALRTRVDATTCRDILRAAGEFLAEPSDLLDIGRVDIATLIGEDGEVDAGAIAEACSALTASRPGLAKPRPQATSFEQGARTSVPAGGVTMQGFIRDSLRGNATRSRPR
jgi:hypothetical protein